MTGPRTFPISAEWVVGIIIGAIVGTAVGVALNLYFFDRLVPAANTTEG